MVTWVFKDGTERKTREFLTCGLRDNTGHRPIKAIVPVGTSEEDLHDVKCALHGSPRYDAHIVDTEGNRLT